MNIKLINNAVKLHLAYDKVYKNVGKYARKLAEAKWKMTGEERKEYEKRFRYEREL